MSRALALHLLWEGFKCKLIDHWDLYSTFGDTLEDAKDQIKFCEGVIERMQQVFAENGIDYDALNHLTLHNYFKTDGFSIHAKTKTLNSFSAFIGYENWKLFQEKVNTREITEDTFSSCSYKPAKEIQKQKAGFRNIPKWVFALFALLLIFSLAFILWKKSQTIQIQKELISQVVRNANEAEFQAYKNIPQIDSAQLKAYFTEDGTAYNSVLGLLLRSKRKKRSLLVPPSSYVLESIEVAEIGKQQGVAYTTEHWIIRWYDSLSQRELLFDTVNQHTYYLVKMDGEWKINVDMYEGKARIPASEVGE
jgi:hypothetical protein